MSIIGISGQKGKPLLSPTAPSFAFVLFRSLSNTTNPSFPAAVITNRRFKSWPNDLQHAVDSFNNMVQMRPSPPLSQFSKVLGNLAKMGHYNTALSLIDKLQFLGIPVDIYIISIAMKCYCHLNRVDFGFSLLGGLFKRGYKPDAITFTTLINGLILQDKTVEAEELFKKLVRNKEIEPDVVMYGSIVNGLCKTGNTSSAISFLRIMEEGSCKPNTIVYSTIIDSLCKDRMVDDALNLFSEMNARGIHPDVVTYNSLIHGLCNFGKTKEAIGMLREMLVGGISLDVHTFTVLVDALTKEGKAKEAEDVLENMIQRGVDPDAITYNILMDGYCLQGQMDEALRVFNTMVERGMHLFVKMEQNGSLPNDVTYSVIIRGFFAGQKCHEALILLEEMIGKGFSPDASIISLDVDLISTKGHNHTLEEFLKRFVSKNGQGI